MDIEPDSSPMTLADVRENVEMLIRKLDGQPGVEWLGLVHAMLDNAECHCQPPLLGQPAKVVQFTPRKS